MEKDFAVVDASVWTGNMCLYMYVMRFCFCDRGILGLVIECWLFRGEGTRNRQREEGKLLSMWLERMRMWER